MNCISIVYCIFNIVPTIVILVALMALVACVASTILKFGAFPLIMSLLSTLVACDLRFIFLIFVSITVSAIFGTGSIIELN